MKQLKQALGYLALWLGGLGIFALASLGESFPPPPMKDKLIYVIRVPAPSPLSP